MTTNWKIGDRVSFSLEIDSDLLSAIKCLAADEGKTVNEKIEDTLWWEVEHSCENQGDLRRVPKVQDMKPWNEMTREEKLAEVARQLEEEEESGGEKHQFDSMDAG